VTHPRKTRRKPGDTVAFPTPPPSTDGDGDGDGDGHKPKPKPKRKPKPPPEVWETDEQREALDRLWANAYGLVIITSINPPPKDEGEPR